MANPWRGEVELVVDGEPRVMRLTLAALAERMPFTVTVYSALRVAPGRSG